MKIDAQLITLVLSLVVARVGALCDFSNGFQLLNETRMCLESIPVNETWIDNTVVTVLGTLQQYSFLDLYRSSGEPWNYEINTMEELESLWGQSFASDWEFQVCPPLCDGQLRVVIALQTVWVVQLIS